MPRPNYRTHQQLNRRELFRFSMIVIALIGAFSIFGCGKAGGGNRLQIKSATTGDKDLPVKSSYAFAVTKTFTDVSGKMTTASAYNVYVANYDLDANNFAMTLDRPLTSDDQVRVVFSLIGEQGTNDKSPPKAATYSARADKFVKVESAGIVARRAGADVKSWLDRSTLSGEVKVTSASADEISGDADLISGNSSIHGSFTAKVLKRK